MALLPMRHVPDQILRQQAKKIGKISPTLKKYTDDMIETMRSERGVGLAANQVGSLQKVVVIQLPEWEEAMVLINPEIVHREGEREVEEGCLSIPGYRGTVRRAERIRAKALGLNGKVIRIKADGLLAQALEHETDHVHGKLYIDNLVSRETFWKLVVTENGDIEYQSVTGNTRPPTETDAEQASPEPEDEPE